MQRKSKISICYNNTSQQFITPLQTEKICLANSGTNGLISQETVLAESTALLGFTNISSVCDGEFKE